MGARSLNVKRTVQLEKAREAPRTLQAVGKNAAKPDLEIRLWQNSLVNSYLLNFFNEDLNLSLCIYVFACTCVCTIPVTPYGWEGDFIKDLKIERQIF